MSKSPSSHKEQGLREKLEEILPRTNCPASCDGYGTYATADEQGDPEPNQCQWCFEVVMPLREKLLALIKTETNALLDSLLTRAEPVIQDGGEKLQFPAVPVSAINKLRKEV